MDHERDSFKYVNFASVQKLTTSLYVKKKSHSGNILYIFLKTKRKSVDILRTDLTVRQARRKLWLSFFTATSDGIEDYIRLVRHSF